MFQKLVSQLVEIVLRFMFMTPLKIAASKLIRSWAYSDPTSWQYHLSCSLQENAAEANQLPICGYCHWVVWPDEGHESCEAMLTAFSQDAIDKETAEAWTQLEKESAHRPNCDCPECRFVSIELALEEEEKEPEDFDDDDLLSEADGPWGEQDYSEGEEDDYSSSPPAAERVFHTRTCQKCGKQFRTSNSSQLCYECTLKDVCGDNPPEEGDFNTAGIRSGTISNEALSELKDYI